MYMDRIMLKLNWKSMWAIGVPSHFLVEHIP